MRKNKGTSECDKSMVTSDVSTSQCEDSIIKCEGKKKPPNVTKIQSYVTLVLHNVRTVPSNVRKNKRTTECNKSTVTYDVEPSQYEDGTIKCEKK